MYSVPAYARKFKSPLGFGYYVVVGIRIFNNQKYAIEYKFKFAVIVE